MHTYVPLHIQRSICTYISIYTIYRRHHTLNSTLPPMKPFNYSSYTGRKLLVRPAQYWWPRRASSLLKCLMEGKWCDLWHVWSFDCSIEAYSNVSHDLCCCFFYRFSTGSSTTSRILYMTIHLPGIAYWDASFGYLFGAKTGTLAKVVTCYLGGKGSYLNVKAAGHLQLQTTSCTKRRLDAW